MKRPWESWVWLACVVVIAGCITWRSLHPNQYDSRLDVQVMQEYAIPSSLAFLALHILAVYWLLCRSGRLTGGESGHLLPLDALYAFLIVPFQNFFSSPPCRSARTCSACWPVSAAGRRRICAGAERQS